MTYAEIMTYISELPPFIPVKRKGRLLFDLRLVTELVHRLGDPQDKLKCVHIAGTNGKGSVAGFLSAILQESGCRVGTFTSPYLEKITEQFQIDGQVIGESEFAEVMSDVVMVSRDMTREGIGTPSEFEMCTAAAFVMFLKGKCDVCVIEAGLGGEYDATNVIKTPLLSVFTPIDIDHISVLGETLTDIAKVKAGIIKKGCACISARQCDEVMAVLEERARELGADLRVADDAVNVMTSLEGTAFTIKIDGAEEEFSLGVVGAFQAKNAALALIAAMMLKSKGFGGISCENIKRGLLKVKRPGRFEVLRRDPVFIADGAHNPAGVRELSVSLKEIFGERKLTFIAGMLADKDVGAMVEPLIPFMKKVYTVEPDNPRAMRAEELQKIFEDRGVEAVAAKKIKRAVECALRDAGSEGAVVAFGSLYYLGEVRSYFESVCDGYGQCP